MQARSDTSGFVLEYERPTAGEAALWAVRSGSDGTVASSRVARLLVRSFPTTPEAETEQQPFVSPRVVLVYCGRVDNRREIAHRLGRPELAQAADGEVLAAAYVSWGPDFPAKVLGEYSCALIDRASGCLVAARDSLGIGHLFKYERGGTVWVTSSLPLLLEVLAERPTLDREALAEYVASGGLLTSGRTIYEGIRELPAAHVLHHGPGGTSVRRYWQPDPERQLACRTEDEYYEAFRCLLAQATEAALRSNSPVWSDVSGGLDSSTVTAMAARLVASGIVASQGLAAFSLVASQTTRSDESLFQRELVACYQLERHTVDIDEYPSFTVDEPPSSHPCKASVYRPITDASRRLFESHGVRVHLTGVGGDNIFCGDQFPPLHLSELAGGLKWIRWWRELSGWAQRGDRSYWNLLWHCSRRQLNDFYAGTPKGDIPTWLAAPFREEVKAADAEPWVGGSRLFASAARELQWRSISQTAAIVRHVRVQDERRPLLFRPLVEFTLALPWKLLQTPQHDRVIQREGLKGILPDAIRHRTTKTSATPVLLRGLRENWSRMQRVAKGRRLVELGLVTPPAFYAACERLRHGVLADQFRYLAGALSLEMWLEANLDPQVGIDPPVALAAEPS